MNFNPIKPFIIQIPRQEIHGINPNLTYEPSGKSFELPCFPSVEMLQAGLMNKIAENKEYQKLSNIIPENLSPKDYKRLTSDNYEDSFNRAVWINPKNGKGYYLLKEGENKSKNIIQLRIINNKGEFVKNANIKCKNILLTDLSKTVKNNTEIAGIPFNHTDFIEILAKRYNPFAKYEIKHIDEDTDIIKLKDNITPDTSCITASYGVFHSKPILTNTGLQTREYLWKLLSKEEPKEIVLLENLKDLSKKTRVLASAGNDGEEIAGLLLKTGFEGVGGLDNTGEIHINSGSKDKLFTQHYEPYSFAIIKTKDGINISGLKGTDFELDSDIAEGTYLGKVSGTSYSTPVRAAKLALNEMMEGVL